MMQIHYRGYEIETFTSIWGAGIGISWWPTDNPDEVSSRAPTYLRKDDAINAAKMEIDRTPNVETEK